MKCFLLRLFSPLLSTTRICDFLRCQLLLGFDKIIICRIEEIKHEGDAADNKYPNQNTKVYITSRRETFKVYSLMFSWNGSMRSFSQQGFSENHLLCSK